MIITFCNEKGGVAKTTTTLAFANGLKKRGYSVCCIDSDPQPANLSLALKADKDTSIGSYELFTARPGLYKISDYIQQTKICDCIAANELLKNAELTLKAPDERFTSAIKEIKKQYDYILIDTPPALGLLTINALLVSDQLIIPTTADLFGVAGVVGVLNHLEELSDKANFALNVAGILLTQYRSNTRLQTTTRDAYMQIAAEYKTKIFNTNIRQSIKVQEAQRAETTLFEYDANSAVAIDYESVIDEYLKG